MTDPLMDVQNVRKEFGEVIAVDDVSFTIEENAGITALIGPNGAGKTTTYNVLTGKLKPTHGTIMFRGEDITDDDTTERIHKGIGRSFQITNIFEGLTVRENLRIPVTARSREKWDALSKIENNDEINDEVDRILDLVGLEDIAEEQCDTLSYGDKRRVEIGITLATDPHLVMLDEPTAGMNPKETSKMVDLIEELDERTDTSFFLTEHDMNVVFSIADRIIVLHQGAILADDTPEGIQNNQKVQTAYLGSEGKSILEEGTDAAFREAGDRSGEALLDIDDIHTYYGQSHVLDGVSLEVHEGEIVGLLGRNGAGKTTTLRSIVGLTPPRRGSITFKGERIDGNHPYQIARAGIGFVPEDRRVFTDLTIRDNLEIAMDEESDWSLQRAYEMFPVLEEKASKKGYQLSGGEQQMLTVARAMVSDPDLLVLDEPSEGLAPVIVEDLEEILSEVIETGITVLITEQNVEFCLSLSERNYILNNGQVEWGGTTEELLENREIIDRYISLSGVE